jgi:intracellular septation protein A
MGGTLKQESKSLINLMSNVAFSIVIPIFILNSEKLPFSPEIRLIIAILFPLLYGAFDWWQTKKHNLLAMLGLINVVITGGFGLLQLEGMWFALKEAVFPLLIGIFVLISGFRGEPFIGKMLLSPEIFDTAKLQSQLEIDNKQSAFEELMRQSNHFLAFSFFVSALLNFIIAQKTFLPIETALPEAERANQLNNQIALMHQRGFLGIALPSMLMLLGLLIYYFKQLEKLTGSSIDVFLIQPSKEPDDSKSL